jgi:hypothetical protein
MIDGIDDSRIVKDKKDNEIECYISNKTLVIDFNNDDNDFSNIPMTQYFNMYCDDNRIILVLGEKSDITINVDHPKAVLNKIKKVIKKYHKEGICGFR